MKDSTSICISWVAIELFSALDTPGRGGRLPNAFLAYGGLGIIFGATLGWWTTFNYYFC